MDKPKGGRGHSAPYETKQMRVPTGLEPQIQELISRFRQWISDAAPGGLGVNSPPKLLDKPVDKLAQDQLDSVRSQLKDCRADGERLAFENGRFLAAQQKAEAAIEGLRSQISALQSQLADQVERAKATEAELAATQENLSYELDRGGGWYSRLGELETEAEELRSQLKDYQESFLSAQQKAKAAMSELRSQLKAAQAELEELRSRSESQKADPKAIKLLKNAITPKSKGGSYVVNNATGLRKLVEAALRLLS